MGLDFADCGIPPLDNLIGCVVLFVAYAAVEYISLHHVVICIG